jgi:hypothetical protein
MQNGILKGVNGIIDKKLGVWSIGKTSPHYRHKEACDQLHRVPLKNFADELLKKVYDQIKKNWKARPRKEPPSDKNWRFQPKRSMAKKNPSLEIQLQRAVVNINQKMWPDAENWTNHVPTASGLWDHKCDKHRAIDLVHVRPGQNRYDTVEFIELKVDKESGHPVYAAIEVLLYGMLYSFSRRRLDELEYDIAKQPLLQAKTIHLVVLAPCEYYKGYQFEWLEMEITKGLKGFIKKSEGYVMDFQFQAFPRDFSAEESIRDRALVKEALKDRQKIENIGQQWRDEAKRFGCATGGAPAVPGAWVGKRRTKRA